MAVLGQTKRECAMMRLRGEVARRGAVSQKLCGDDVVAQFSCTASIMEGKRPKGRHSTDTSFCLHSHLHYIGVEK